jgi:hypothetical protein
MTTSARRRTAAVRLANVSMTAGLLETSAAAPTPLINNAQNTTTGGTGPAYAAVSVWPWLTRLDIFRTCVRK